MGLPTNRANGYMYLKFIQGGTGDYNIVTWHSIWRFQDAVAPTIDGVPGTEDFFIFFDDGEEIIQISYQNNIGSQV